MDFVMHTDISNIKDSLQFDSDTEIATLTLDNGDEVFVMTRGCVKVSFDEVDYTVPSEFPQELKNIIANGEIDDSDRVYISENNWFEMFYSSAASDTFAEDHSTIVNIEGRSADDIRKMMLDFAEEYSLDLSEKKRAKKNEDIER